MPNVILDPAPGVYVQEVDLSTRANAAATQTGAVVGAFAKGNLTPEFWTNQTDFGNHYLVSNDPAPKYGFAGYTGLAFLTQSTSMWGLRVVDDALYGGIAFTLDSSSNPTETLWDVFPEGTLAGFEGGARNIQNLIFNIPMTSGQTFSIEVTNGERFATFNPVAFSGNWATTVANIATELQAAMDTLSPVNVDAVAEVVPVISGNSLIIRVYPPTDASLELEAAQVTGSGTLPHVTIDDDVQLFTVFAVNPGNWNNTIGVQIVDVDVGTQERYQIRFAGPLITSNLVNMTINGQPIETTTATLAINQAAVTGNTFSATVNGTPITVNFATTSDDFLRKIAATILNAIEPGSVSQVVQVANSNGSQETTINVVSGVPFTITGSNITGGVSQPNVNVTGPATANGVAFVQDSDTTMQAIASAIAGVDTVAAATVTVIAGSNTNDRDIIVVALASGPNELAWTNLTVTGGASQTIFTESIVLNGVLPSGAFTIEVFTSDNVNIPKERFIVSLAEQLDGFGQQMNIVYVINNSAQRSDFIRVVQPTTSQSLSLVPILFNGQWVVTPTILFLSGGDDGNAVSDSDINNGWNTNFSNRDKIQIRLALNAGYSTPAVQQNITTLCQTRMDCMAILDMPSSSQSQLGTSETNYRNLVMNIDSNYAAIYTPDVQILDSVGRTIYVPPSGYVGAVYAYNDKVRAEWFAPAGLQVGLIPNLLGLRFQYDHGICSLFASNQINPILKKPGWGYPVFDALTLQSVASALSNVNVRRLLIVLEVAVTDSLEFELFSPNDSILQAQCIQIVTSILQPILEGRGLLAYQVVADSTNNPPIFEDLGQLNVDCYLQPTIPARKILFRPILTATGASFQELIAAGGP